MHYLSSSHDRTLLSYEQHCLSDYFFVSYSISVTTKSSLPEVLNSGSKPTSELWKVEEIEKGVLAPLLLSYNDLPSKIKICFSYYAIFPKDYYIEKEYLITLWMAQGYLNSKQEEEMEIIGEEYFGILASQSFFHDFKKDDDDNIVRCKMHDIVHDLAQFISQNECLSIEINGGEELSMTSLDGKVCHLMVNLGYNAASFPAVATGRLKRLYSLLIDGHNNIDNSSLIEFLQELFSESRCLRALDFGYPQESSDMIREILINAEKMVHLRYLNLDC